MNKVEFEAPNLTLAEASLIINTFREEGPDDESLYGYTISLEQSEKGVEFWAIRKEGQEHSQYYMKAIPDEVEDA